MRYTPQHTKLSRLSLSLFASAVLLASPYTFAQSVDDAQGGAVEVTDEMPAAPPTPAAGSRVGRKAAEKYMAPRAKTGTRRTENVSRTSASQLSSSDHYLAVHLGGYVSSTAYKWGTADTQTGAGQTNIGVTYRMGEWRNSMDLNIRIDYAAYSLDVGRASKLSFLPVITFPDASSKFPLFFGVGAGLGIFTSQIGGESAISLDYQLIAGARFFDIFENTGFFIEAGLKNHVLLLSDGQFNGTFVALGPVFTF